MVVDDEEKANILNTFFSTVFTVENEMLGEIPRNNENPILRVTNLTQEEVRNRLNKIKIDKSPGPDGIHPRVLRELSNVIDKPLFLIFSDSIATGSVPQDWRIANVVPIFKKGSKSEPGNYRPRMTSEVEEEIRLLGGGVSEPLVIQELLERLRELENNNLRNIPYSHPIQLNCYGHNNQEGLTFSFPKEPCRSFIRLKTPLSRKPMKPNGILMNVASMSRPALTQCREADAGGRDRHRNVANHVVQALLNQKDLREECIKLKKRVFDLERQNRALSDLFHQKLQRSSGSSPELHPLQALSDSHGGDLDRISVSLPLGQCGMPREVNKQSCTIFN
ncbi:unnamed protein product [Ranitomeya imitator]|uniref:Uncharacterized protein n=1 Tax=Ranitomeya imitator TaxID=111125 RepID=A0ABN9L9Y8_9NEOB|nr:unnamed protein product [Ranitomeya imitator]